MTNEVSKEQQIFQTEEGLKRAIFEKKEVAFEEKRQSKAKKRASRVIKEIEDLQKKGKPSYVISYGEVHRSIDRDESNIEEGEGWNLFDWRLNPNADRSDLSQSERDFQFILMNNLGFSIKNEPPYSIEKEKLSVAKGTTQGRKVYYAESPLYLGIYITRMYEKRGIWRQDLNYGKTEQELQAMLNLPQTPAA